MIIRPYRPPDDEALMALERLCPRGAPHAFVHYRRRFVDRAALFNEHLVLVVEGDGGEIVAAVASGIKETHAGGQPLRLGYLFDVRVAPAARRQGLALTLLRALEEALVAQGCDGAYAHVVSSNLPSVRLFATLGYEQRRPLHFLSFEPAPAAEGAAPLRDLPPLAGEALGPYPSYDLFVRDVAAAVRPYGLERWAREAGAASLSLFDQSQLFQQVPADAPWPTPEEIARRGSHWRLFHPLGAPDALAALLATLRARAAAAQVSQLSLLVDPGSALAPCFHEQATAVREYTVMTRPFHAGWDGTIHSPFYCDPREL